MTRFQTRDGYPFCMFCGQSRGSHIDLRCRDGSIEETYGADNPMVKWLQAKHPGALKERIKTMAPPLFGEEDE